VDRVPAVLKGPDVTLCEVQRREVRGLA
jgi:hypothetical protein